MAKLSVSIFLSRMGKKLICDLSSSSTLAPNILYYCPKPWHKNCNGNCFVSTVCICWHERQLCSQCAIRRATGMLVAAIYSAWGNTENIKGCQVSVFCWLPVGPGVFNSTCKQRRSEPKHSYPILSYPICSPNKCQYETIIHVLDIV